MATTSNKSTPKRKKPKAKAPTKAYKKRQKNLIFALDIGTRTIVGIVGEEKDGVFNVIDSIVAPHTKRAMVDGQIEEIDEVAKIVGSVKKELENRLGVCLSNVSIAAAGRALKTQRIKTVIDVPTIDEITPEISRAFEIEAVSKAQKEIDIDIEKSEQNIAFYCVGHSVVSFELDGYPMKSVIGHKGKQVTIEVIAAFLPSAVIESLYSVMEKNKLTVSSLTLEPIAAMNVIIPPEVRLINIALVDIGAGTSDIAISRNGSIVSYAMATVAGDEITEEIIKKYLVDFDMAEYIKGCSDEEEFEYKDILGMTYKKKYEDLLKDIAPAIDNLADTVCRYIIEANGESPAAVFLVGGGSKITGLSNLVAQKLDIPNERVAIGGHNFIKNVAVGESGLTGPEFVTPIGIGVTATLNKGYDFSVITINDKKIRVLNTKSLTIFDMLLMSGYKTRQIIGSTGRNLNFTLNGERVTLKGSISIPSQIFQNDELCRVDSPVNHGDRIKIIPATSGVSAEASILDMVGDCAINTCKFNQTEYQFGVFSFANGTRVYNDYSIKNSDEITFYEISSINELVEYNKLGDKFIGGDYQFKVGKAIVNDSYILKNGDVIEPVKKSIKTNPVVQKNEDYYPKEKELVDVDNELHTQEVSTTENKTVERFKEDDYITVFLNGKRLSLEKKTDGTTNTFLEVLRFVDVDTMDKKGSLVMRVNGEDAMYTSEIFDGDNIEIYFE